MGCLGCLWTFLSRLSIGTLASARFSNKKKDLRGGHWVDQSRAGDFGLYFFDPRSYVVSALGFRAFTINKNRGGCWWEFLPSGVFDLYLHSDHVCVLTRLGFRAFQTNKTAVATGTTLHTLGYLLCLCVSLVVVRTGVSAPALFKHEKKRGGFWATVSCPGVFGLALDYHHLREDWALGFRARFTNKKKRSASAVAIGITLLNPACSN